MILITVIIDHFFFISLNARNETKFIILKSEFTRRNLESGIQLLTNIVLCLRII